MENPPNKKKDQVGFEFLFIIWVLKIVMPHKAPSIRTDTIITL